MRNLRNIRHSTWRVPPDRRERQLTAAAWDTSSNSIIACFGPSSDDNLIELVRIKQDASSDHSLITSWDAPCPNPSLPCDQVLSLHYFGDSLTACLVLAGGDIVVVREDPLPGEDKIEIVGSVDAGITAARWSPDEDLLAISTKADTLVFMSRTFEGIMDVSMTAEDLKASNHVSVGWGKKETQFQGRGAKALRDPTVPEKIDAGNLSADDDGKVTISWRGDGAFLAVSTIHDSVRRIIRVYSREGALDSVSEPVDGLEGALSWRPAGNLMAGIQRLADRVDVVFFERNGLRHGQFTLKDSATELKGRHIRLFWNNDSTVLAVVIDDSIQLWTTGNYHWYLKQEVRNADGRDLKSAQMIWHPEKPLKFTVVASYHVTSLEYVFTIARGSTASPNDYGIVAVVDAKILKCTPFRSANVPPPMSYCDIEVTDNIVDVAMKSSTTASTIAILHQTGVSFFEWKTNPKSSVPELSGRITFSKIGKSDCIYRQVSFGPDNGVLALAIADGRDEINCYGFDNDTGRMSEKPLSRHEAKAVPAAVFFHENQPCCQDSGGNLFAVEQDRQTKICQFPTFMPWMEVTKVPGKLIAFGLSSNGHLYANSRLLLKNCTSFLVTPAHLILTTTTHMLKFVHITDVDDLEVPKDDPEKDERCRSIERGARLVTAMPSTLNLVLQMPRGNLETIWPRAMVLAGIRGLIRQKNYKGAFAHCRTQRVDMNILYDHDPKQFLGNVSAFVDQVKKVTYIDLFLSSLREEDVTETMYKDTRTRSTIEDTTRHTDMSAPTTHASKVNRICDAFLQVFQTRTATNLQNLITANVCKSPPALDDGLLVVADLMSSDEHLAEKAAEHICFLADANKLYDSALGLYNLDLALLIAQQSQKDPREYLPFLQSLQEMQTLRRQFSIDNHLGRFQKALTSLHALSTESRDELEAYVVKHILYQDALTLYRYNSEAYSVILHLYAQHLEATSQFHAAALAYESLSDFAPAATCYQRAGAAYFREALYCASVQTPPLSPEAITTLAQALSDSLYEAKDYLSSAHLQENYLNNIPSAITTLSKGFHFAAALLLAVRHNKIHPSLLAPNGLLDTGLTDALSSTSDLLSECTSQLKAQVPRILELRTKAAADPLAYFEGDANPDLPDDVSVAASSRISTSASLFTRYTGRQSLGTAASNVSHATSKNRRREERKRARGKKGSVYEEEYLVASVGRLVKRVESTRDEVARLVEALVRRGMTERARAVEGMMVELIRLCAEAVELVFGDGDRNSGGGTAEQGERSGAVYENGIENGNGSEGRGGAANHNGNIDLVAAVGPTEAAYRPTGGDGVLAESLEAMGRKQVAPVIGKFERLTLLGT